MLPNITMVVESALDELLPDDALLTRSASRFRTDHLMMGWHDSTALNVVSRSSEKYHLRAEEICAVLLLSNRMKKAIFEVRLAPIGR